MIANDSPEIRDPYRHWIAVIGMGAAGASLFSALLDRIIANDMAEKVGFLLIDERPTSEFGRGIAWSSAQHQAFRANMRMHTISFKQRTLERIAKAAEITGFNTYDELTDEQMYQQRIRIGDALHEDFKEDLSRAEGLGIPAVTMSTTVTDLHRRGIGFCLSSPNQHPQFANSVVLALGNVPNYPMNNLRGCNNYLHNPWNWEQYSLIPTGLRVAVIGLGPTAVDAIILLTNKRPRKLVAYSRTGRLQYPRPHNSEHVLTDLSEKFLTDLVETRRLQGHDGIPFDMLHGFLTAEFMRADACAEWQRDLNNSQKAPRDALYAGLQDANKDSKWYSVLKALDAVTPLIWNSLDDRGRRRYMDELRRDHTIMSYGMASVQARRILGYMENNKLEIRGGAHAVKYDAVSKTFKIDLFDKVDVKRLINSDEFDIVVNCTGIGSDVANSNSPLIQSLLVKEWIVPHPHGGICVDFDTGHILNSGQKRVGEFYSLVGSLTFGTHLLTNCLWQVWQSSDRTAQAITRSLAQSTPALG